jgi:hypothetical protein
MGSAGAEKENCEMEVAALEIVMLRLSFSFVKVTVCDARLEPNDSVPKRMAVGLALTVACATLANANRIVAAAIVLTRILLLSEMFILFPSFSKGCAS